MKNKDMEILKRVIRDYNIMNREIIKRVNEGYNFDMLCDYIRHLSSCNITNYSDNVYCDFNYCDMCISIYSDDNGDNCYLGDSIEVWDDDNNYLIGTYNCVEEIELLVKEMENFNEE